jgi:hypothetical protein
VNATALFIDETFITIGKKTWYLIVIINEAGRVLEFNIVRHRTASVILAMLFPIIMRLKKPFTHLITDGFSSYKKVAKMIGRDIIHVQHIHKPPYGRVIITKITHTAEKIILKTFASMNDVFTDKNGFTGQVKVTEEKKNKGKRGRPKGSKDQTNRKARDKSRVESIVQDGKQGEESGGKEDKDSQYQSALIKEKKKVPREKKRAREFKNGETNVYFHDAEKGTVTALYGSDEEIRDVLASLIPLFGGMCITTNLIESLFSACKVLVNFRGCRTLESWLECLSAHFIIRGCPEALQEALDELQITAYLGNKMLSLSNIEIGSYSPKAVASA